MPWCSGPRPVETGPVDTLIFVDVDGVLNVGVRDPGACPVGFSAANIARAARIMETPSDDSPERLCAERIAAAFTRATEDNDNKSYAHFVDDDATGVSNLLLDRLVEIIAKAGRGRLVVLSSTWRLPQYTAKVQLLERAIAKRLGEPFSFGARTTSCKEHTPEQRLALIGEFLEQWAPELTRNPRPPRVIILEDFHISSMHGWACDGLPMHSADDCVMYLHGRAPELPAHSIRLCHTYEEWETPQGVLVQLGCGITKKHLRQSLEFLDRSQRPSAPTAEQLAPVQNTNEQCAPCRVAGDSTLTGKRTKKGLINKILSSDYLPFSLKSR